MSNNMYIIYTLKSRGAVVHVVPPVLVLAEGATVACLVAATAGLGSLTSTVPATLGGGSRVTKKKRNGQVMAITKLTSIAVVSLTTLLPQPFLKIGWRVWCSKWLHFLSHRLFASKTQAF